MEIISRDTEPAKNKPTESVSVKKRIRLPLLKSLIYLGGSASEDDIVEYLQKDMRKNLNEDELEIDESTNEAKWVSNLKRECSTMRKEDLLISDKSGDRWSITQKGIDFLAKNDD